MIDPVDQYGLHAANIVIGDDPPEPEPVPPNAGPLPDDEPAAPIPEPPGLDRPTELAVAPSLPDLNRLLYGGVAQLADAVLSQLDEVSYVLDEVSFFNVPNPGFFIGATMPAPEFSGIWRQEFVVNDGQNSTREELFFQKETQAADPANTARNHINTCLDKRKELLGGDGTSSEQCHPGRARIAHVSFGDARKIGRGDSFDCEGNVGFPTHYAAQTPSDTLWKRVAVELRAATTGGNPLRGTRTLLLAGIPDRLLLSGSLNLPNNLTWKNRWESFRDYLIGDDGAMGPIGNANSAYGMLLHDTRSGTGNEIKTVIGATVVNGAPRLQLAQALTLAGGNAVVSGDIFRLMRANVPGWSGEYKVKVIDSKTVELIEPVRGAARYIFEILRTNPSLLPKPTYGQLTRIRRKDGEPTWAFAKFNEGRLIEIVRRRPSPAWSPYQPKRQRNT